MWWFFPHLPYENSVLIFLHCNIINFKTIDCHSYGWSFFYFNINYIVTSLFIHLFLCTLCTVLLPSLPKNSPPPYTDKDTKRRHFSLARQAVSLRCFNRHGVKNKWPFYYKNLEQSLVFTCAPTLYKRESILPSITSNENNNLQLLTLQRGTILVLRVASFAAISYFVLEKTSKLHYKIKQNNSFFFISAYTPKWAADGNKSVSRFLSLTFLDSLLYLGYKQSNKILFV